MGKLGLYTRQNSLATAHRERIVLKTQHIYYRAFCRLEGSSCENGRIKSFKIEYVIII